MKHKNILISILALFLLTIVSTAAQAREIKIYLNGSRLRLDAQPISKKGLVFVPLRGIFEKMGASVSFYKDQGKIVSTRGNTNIVLILNQSYAKVNGFKKRVLYPPFVKNNRTYVPLRFLSESLGCEVGWHPPSSTVVIVGAKETKGGKGSSINGASFQKAQLQQQLQLLDKLMKSPKSSEEDDGKIKPIKSSIKKIEPVKKNAPTPGKTRDRDKDDMEIDEVKIDD